MLKGQLLVLLLFLLVFFAVGSLQLAIVLGQEHDKIIAIFIRMELVVLKKLVHLNQIVEMDVDAL